LADAKATEIYASAYNQSREAVEFYEFTRTMQSYESIMAENTTLLVSTDSDLFKFLKGMRGQEVWNPHGLCIEQEDALPAETDHAPPLGRAQGAPRDAAPLRALLTSFILKLC
jgi:hypothetical protein